MFLFSCRRYVSNESTKLSSPVSHAFELARELFQLSVVAHKSMSGLIEKEGNGHHKSCPCSWSWVEIAGRSDV